MLLYILLTFLIQNTQVLNDKPLHSGTFSVQKILTLSDSTDGYYQNLSVRSTKDNHYYLMDRGNVRFYKYDSSGKELLRFGKKGNGPGEISSGWGKIFVENGFVFKTANSGHKITIFNSKGDFIQVLKTAEQFTKFIEFDGKILKTYYGLDFDRKTTYEKFKYDGKKFYKLGSDENTKHKQRLSKNFETSVVEDFKTNPFSIIKLNSFYYGSYKGSYRIAKFSEYCEPVLEKTRVVKRLERKPYYDLTGQKLPKETVAFYAKLEKQLFSLDGGFKHDISYIAGSFKNYLFVVRATEKKSTLHFDILDENLQFIDELILELPDFESVEEVKNGKLIISCKNDDIGLYALVYKINTKI